MPAVHPNEASHTHAMTGSLLVALAAIGSSGKAILVKLAYLHQVDAVTLLALRMAFALPFFLLMGVLGMPAAAQGKLGRAAVSGLGLLGYYLASFLDFWGPEYISAGLERLILFLYPTGHPKTGAKAVYRLCHDRRLPGVSGAIRPDPSA